MSDLNYNRCYNDDMRAASAQIGENPETGQPIELNINGVAAVIAVQSAMLTVGAAMKAGHEPDFLEKVSLTLFDKLANDPHAICPLLTICCMCLTLLTEAAGISFNAAGEVVIAPPDMGPGDPADTCMFDDEEDDDYGTDEGTLGTDGTGPSGGDDGLNP